MNQHPVAHRVRLRRGRRSNRRGAATVEFAVAAPFLTVLLLGMIDVGQLVNVGQTVSEASAFAARQAAKSSVDSVADVENCTAEFLGNRFQQLSAEQIDSFLEVSVCDSDGNVMTETDLEGVESGSAVSVEVAFSFDSVRWLTGVGLGQGRTLQTATVVRRQ